MITGEAEEVCERMCLDCRTEYSKSNQMISLNKNIATGAYFYIYCLSVDNVQ